MFSINEYLKKENNIETFIKKYKTEPHSVILFGLGGSIDVYFELLNKYAINIDYIIDNNPAKIGTIYNGIRINAASILSSIETAYIIITAPSHSSSIISQITNLTNKHIVIQFDPSLEIIQNVSHKERVDFYTHNKNSLISFYDNLADDISKLTFEKVIEGALTSNNCCYNEISTNNQYFPDIIMENLTENETFLDIGAFTGDSSIEFIKAVNNNFNKIIGFEPKNENIKIALSLINDKRVQFYPYGIGEKSEQLYLYGNDGIDDFAHISDKKNENCTVIEIKSIDDFLSESYTYMKMDIEGMEIPALLGAAKTIKQYHPKLAVSIYHKLDDFITIPKIIMDIDPSYKLYLRHYWGYCGTDSILFAI